MSNHMHALSAKADSNLTAAMAAVGIDVLHPWVQGWLFDCTAVFDEPWAGDLNLTEGDEVARLVMAEIARYVLGGDEEAPQAGGAVVDQDKFARAYGAYKAERDLLHA